MPFGGRLHIAAVPLFLVKRAPWLIPLSIPLTRQPALAWALLVVAVTASVARWARFGWRLERGALILRTGLLTRRQRVIPLERIQAVELVRPIGHRLLGVVEVRIETVGGATVEGRLDALAPEVAQRLRALLLGQGGQAPSPVDQRVLARVAPATIILAGLTGGHVGVAAALLGLGNDFLGDRVEQLFDLPAVIGPRGTATAVALIAIAAFASSVAATAIAYWGFTLREGGEGLLVRRGLLEQRFDTIPPGRIQAVSVDENAARRLLGRAAVRVVVAGRAGEESRQTGVLLPLGRRAEALTLVERVLGVDGLAAARLEAMPKRALTRRIIRAVLASIMLTVAAFAAFGGAGLAAFALIIPLLAWALAAYRALGHAEHAGIVVARAGLLVRRTSFVPAQRLQSLELGASPFQRRARLATLSLRIAGSSASRDPRLHDLDRAVGERLLRRLAEVTYSS